MIWISDTSAQLIVDLISSRADELHEKSSKLYLDAMDLKHYLETQLHAEEVYGKRSNSD